MLWIVSILVLVSNFFTISYELFKFTVLREKSLSSPVLLLILCGQINSFNLEILQIIFNTLISMYCASEFVFFNSKLPFFDNIHLYVSFLHLVHEVNSFVTSFVLSLLWLGLFSPKFLLLLWLLPFHDLLPEFESSPDIFLLAFLLAII